MFRVPYLTCSLLLVAALGSVMQAPALAVQFTTAETFDINRFAPNGGLFETFFVTEATALQDVLRAKTVSAETRVLVTQLSDRKLALLTDQMSFHHIAQGDDAGQPWMVTF